MKNFMKHSLLLLISACFMSSNVLGAPSKRSSRQSRSTAAHKAPTPRPQGAPVQGPNFDLQISQIKEQIQQSKKEMQQSIGKMEQQIKEINTDINKMKTDIKEMNQKINVKTPAKKTIKKQSAQPKSIQQKKKVTNKKKVTATAKSDEFPA